MAKRQHASPTVMNGSSGLPARLRAARQATGISQGEVARRLDCSRAAVSQWEDGTNEPRAVRLRLLANLYNVPHEWLAHGEDSVVRDVREVTAGQLRSLPRQLLEPARAAMGECLRPSLWRLDTDVMRGWHYEPGDLLVVDGAHGAGPRDVVIATYQRRAHLLRVYFPPYLYALPLQAQPAPLVVDGIQVTIDGVVIKRLKA